MASNNGNPLIDTFVHPVRGRAWAMIAEGSGLSAQQVAVRIGEPVGRVRYHLREMRKLGVIELIGENVRRGVVEHVYGSAMPPVVSDPDFDELDTQVKVTIALRVLNLVFADVERALKSNSIQASHLTRVPMRVDPQGWEELLGINKRAWEECERVGRESQERLAARAADPISVSAILLCFHCPPTGV